ncbi:wall-associated receptor kinase 2-like [Camellia sinensis]|uniref:wall-associated receptor kinase 2-like n=1 Tax=Camellia sinensis TaxID=4442 RepID=UPI0010360428|nr:wall-associated receptor kinase 2-like [Camellia sinensis]
MDPMCMLTGFLIEKSDVYSFGMILLELLARKRSIDWSRDRNQQSLLVWVKDSIENDQFNEFVDPRILKNKGGIEQEQQLQVECLIFVKKYDDPNGHLHSNEVKSFAIRGLVVTTLMSNHKNVLKLIGCCLDFEFPASVYECTGSIESLANRLYERKGDIMENTGLLMWKSRLKIAYDIAYAIVYMHTAFLTPIIHRDLAPGHIIINQFGVAKLIDFSLSIPIPPGKKQVEDLVIRTYGYADPEYVHTGILTEKSDVCGFGMILLELLTREKAYDNKRGNNRELLNNCVEDYVDNDQFNELVDPRILEGGTVQEQQFQVVIALALRCTQENREDRPEMIYVAKELRRILKSISTSLPQQ